MPDADIICTTHGFPCRYAPTIMDGPVFRWGERYNGGEISASRNGVMINTGGIAYSGERLETFLDVVEVANRVAYHLSKDDRETEFCKRIARGEV